MGERQSGGGMSDRRRVHPGGIASGHGPGPAAGGHRAVLDDDALETLLAAAMLRHPADAQGEQRAVAAFRAAREAGLHRARARRRDDWRPREQRRPGRSLKAALSLFAASLTLGGVAVAAIGAGDSSDERGDGRGGSPSAATSAPDRPGAEGSPSASDAGSARPGHPGTAQDTEAQCRAYEQVKDRGKALDSTAWQRLVTAAGGENKVDAYCAEQLARATAEPTPKSRPSQAATPGDGAANTGNGADKGTGTGTGTGTDPGTDKGTDPGTGAGTGGGADQGADRAGNGAGNADSAEGTGKNG
jgi:hypothetical protein